MIAARAPYPVHPWSRKHGARRQEAWSEWSRSQEPREIIDLTRAGATTLDELEDVRISSPAGEDILQFDGTEWVNVPPSWPEILDDLADVAIVAPVAEQVLKYNGSAWVNGAASGGATDLDDLSDVTITAPATAQFLRYDGAQWANATAVILDISGLQAALNAKANVAGQVFTGAIIAPDLRLNDVAGVSRTLEWQTSGLARWRLLALSNVETGADAGSDLQLMAFHDDGTQHGQILIVNRASRIATFNNPPVLTNAPVTAANDGQVPTTAWVKSQGYVTSSGVTSVTGTAPVVSSGGATPAISMPAATGSVAGHLTAADWTTFNGKAPAVHTHAQADITNLTADLALKAPIEDARMTGVFCLSSSGVFTAPLLTADVNDWAPDSLDRQTVWLLTSDAARNITGIDAGSSNIGRMLVLYNGNAVGTSSITLKYNSTSSVQGNRFAFGSATDVVLAPNEVITLIRINSRWRPMGAKG